MWAVSGVRSRLNKSMHLADSVAQMRRDTKTTPFLSHPFSTDVVFVPPRCLEPPFLSWWVPTSAVATSLVRTRFFFSRFQASHFPQASYDLVLHKYEPEDFFAVSGLALVPPTVIAWVCQGGAHRLPPRSFYPSCSDTPSPIVFSLSPPRALSYPGPVSQGSPKFYAQCPKEGSCP